METALAIRVYMNSAMEEVLNFKTTCSLRLFDQNLEIHVENCGSRPVCVHSYVDLEGEQGIERIDYLFPSGDQIIAPGDVLAFYCRLDDRTWERSRKAVFYDTEGNRYAHLLGD